MIVYQIGILDILCGAFKNTYTAEFIMLRIMNKYPNENSAVLINICNKVLSKLKMLPN